VHILPGRELPVWVAALSAVPAAPSPFPDGVRMTEGQTEEVVEAIGAALNGAELTVDELGDAVVEATGPWAGDLVMPAFQTMWPRWRQVMHLAGTRGVLCFGPNRGRAAALLRRLRVPGRRDPRGQGAAGHRHGDRGRPRLTGRGLTAGW
jgi:hypothetical protein